MECPKEHTPLKSMAIGSITIDRCAECGGTWFDENEFRILKDKASHGDYCWIDFDLWKHLADFRAAEQQRYNCPRDGHPMTTVNYGTSSIAVDICTECKGLWLDRDKFDAIIDYLDKMVVSKSPGDYLRDVRDEFREIFSGQEGPKSEIKDLSKVLYLLELRFAVEHPGIAAIIKGPTL